MYVGSAEFLNRIFLSMEDWAARLQFKANILTFSLENLPSETVLVKFLFPHTSAKQSNSMRKGCSCFWHLLILKANHIQGREHFHPPCHLPKCMTSGGN